MIAYQITLSVILLLGLHNQIKTYQAVRGPGASRLVLGAFLAGAVVSVVLIVWTWLI